MLITFKRIMDLRIDNDISQRQMAKILNISPDNYYDYEHGRSNFPLDKLNTFVNYFHVSFDYITGLSNEKINYDNNINTNILVKRLKEVRKNNYLSQNKVAKILDDPQSTYWNYENGISVIPISKLYLLSKYYNISIDYLLGKTNKKSILIKGNS